MPVDAVRAQENYERYVYFRDGGHLEFLERAERCENFFIGLQWEEALRRKLENVGRPALTVNEIFASIASIMGEQLSQRADIAFQPMLDGREDTATALTKLWLHISRNNKLDRQESSVFGDGIILSRGFFDVRMRYDNQMRGSIEISTWNPRNILIDCDAEEHDPDKWNDIILTKWLSPQAIEQYYGKDNAEELKNRPSSEFDYGYDSIDYMQQNSFDAPGNAGRYRQDDIKDPRRRRIRVLERQYRELEYRPHFVDRQTGDMRLIPDGWDKDKVGYASEQLDLAVIKKQVSTIHWLTTADNIVLYDNRSPYKHFTPIPYFPFFRRGRTIGLVEHALSAQENLNKTLSQELHVINTTANSGYKVRANALKNMDVEELEQRGAETGLVIELDDVNNLEKILPNQVPTGLDNVAHKAHENVKRMLGTPDSVRGFDRADVAAKAIQYKKVSAVGSLAQPFDSLMYTRQMLAERCLDLVQEYYTEQRMFKIIGHQLAARPEELVVNQPSPDDPRLILNDLTIGEYSVVVTTVPARDTFNESQLDEVLRMRELQIHIPDDIVVEYSSLARKSEIVRRMKEQQGGASSAEVQQRMQQQEMEVQQLEIEFKKADIRKRIAESTLAEARALKAKADADKVVSETPGAAGAEAGVAANEAVAKHQQLADEFTLRREEAQARLKLAREELEHKKQLGNDAHLLAVSQADEAADLAAKKHEDEMSIKREALKAKTAQEKRNASSKKQASGSKRS